MSWGNVSADFYLTLRDGIFGCPATRGVSFAVLENPLHFRGGGWHSGFLGIYGFRGLHCLFEGLPREQKSDSIAKALNVQTTTRDVISEIQELRSTYPFNIVLFKTINVTDAGLRTLWKARHVTRGAFVQNDADIFWITKFLYLLFRPRNNAKLATALAFFFIGNFYVSFSLYFFKYSRFTTSLVVIRQTMITARSSFPIWGNICGSTANNWYCSESCNMDY